MVGGVCHCLGPYNADNYLRNKLVSSFPVKYFGPGRLLWTPPQKPIKWPIVGRSLAIIVRGVSEVYLLHWRATTLRSWPVLLSQNGWFFHSLKTAFGNDSPFKVTEKIIRFLIRKLSSDFCQWVYKGFCVFDVACQFSLTCEYLVTRIARSLHQLWWSGF